MEKPVDINHKEAKTSRIPEEASIISQLVKLPVIVAALGYLVDMYDLFLFSIVRVPSLTDLEGS